MNKKKWIISMITIISIMIISIGLLSTISSESKMSKEQTLYIEFATIHDNIATIVDKDNTCNNINTQINITKLKRAKQIIKATEDILYTDKEGYNVEASMWLDIMKDKIKDLELLFQAKDKNIISPEERMVIQIYKNGCYLISED